MNKPLTGSEAYMKAIEALEYLKQEIQRYDDMNQLVPSFTEEIENVTMMGVLELHNVFDFGNKRLFTPSEIDDNRMTLIWNPFPGCVISFESEPLSKVKIDIKPFNLN